LAEATGGGQPVPARSRDSEERKPANGDGEDFWKNLDRWEAIFTQALGKHFDEPLGARQLLIF
jgi:hypothetical protein